MTNERLLKLATDAGFLFHDAGWANEGILHTDALEYSQRCFDRLAKSIREEALEEAAQVVLQELVKEPKGYYQIDYNAGIQRLVDKIRSLK